MRTWIDISNNLRYKGNKLFSRSEHPDKIYEMHKIRQHCEDAFQ